MRSVIRVEKLGKSFQVRRKGKGVLGALKSLVSKEVIDVSAIKEISFQIARGERVAFIGPNGAGKSTTIKMLTGILYPSSGLVEVLGHVPWKERHTLGFKIGTVFGQRTQLWYHLPPSDTFLLLSKIYEMDQALYKRQLEELIHVFDIAPFLETPVRKLSLGERMRCELVASLLHKPEVVFLDEPTIGLDIHAKLKIRDLLNRLSKEQGTTLFLTSHDTADIEKVSERVIVLDKGHIVLDHSLQELKKSYMKKKIVSFTTDERDLFLTLPGLTLLEKKEHQVVFAIDLEKLSIEKVIQEVVGRAHLKDMTIEDPSMEEIIKTLYGASPYALSSQV